MSWESLCELTTYLKIHITRFLSATPTCMPLRLSCGIGPLLPPWTVAGLQSGVPQFCGVIHQTEQTLGRVTCHASQGKWTGLEPSKTLTQNGYGDKPQPHLFFHSLCTSLSPCVCDKTTSAYRLPRTCFQATSSFILMSATSETDTSFQHLL